MSHSFYYNLKYSCEVTNSTQLVLLLTTPFPGALLALELSALLLLLLLPVVSVALQDGRDGDTAPTAGSEHTEGVRGGGTTKGRGIKQQGV